MAWRLPAIDGHRIGRAVIILAVLVTLGLLGLEMSGSAARTAGSDQVSMQSFVAIVPGGGAVCQPTSPPPADAARAEVLVGTYGRLTPALQLRFLDATGQTVEAGSLAAGHSQGLVKLPLVRTGTVGRTVSFCLRAGGNHPVALAGEGGPGGTEMVDGKHQPGSVGLIYLRRGRESWWQFLPTLASRFGLGKASFFGDWTLPVTGLALLAVWAAAVRVLLKEIR